MTAWDLIVVGGGPAGMMAAGTAASLGLRVLLLEKNPTLGRKLRITGKGRCNLTNDCTVEEAVAAIPGGGRFLYSAFSAFPPQAVMAFFESLGVPLKTERGRRVFPVSDKAADVAEALVRWLKAQGVTVTQAAVTALLTEDGAVTGVRAGTQTFSAPRVILALGGASYPATGSTGDGYALARSVGHTVVPPQPSLVPLVEEGSTCARLMGLSLKNTGVTVTAAGKKKPVYADFGELLFTHFGLSGPTILSASCHLRPMEPGKYTVHLDLKPALSPEKLDARLLRDLTDNANRQLIHSLDALLPQKLIPVLIARSGVPPETRCHDLTREQRRGLVSLLKDFTVPIRGFRPLAEAIVTAGGVSLKEVDPRTLESKRVSGLHIVGELLDADAYTGGYNLQIAWSTGRAAAAAAASVPLDR